MASSLPAESLRKPARFQTAISSYRRSWYPPYLAFSAVIGGICMFGFWKMRRWALFSYTVFCAINQLVLLLTGHWNLLAILLTGIVIAIGFAYLSRMR